MQTENLHRTNKNFQNQFHIDNSLAEQVDHLFKSTAHHPLWQALHLDWPLPTFIKNFLENNLLCVTPTAHFNI